MNITQKGFLSQDYYLDSKYTKSVLKVLNERLLALNCFCVVFVYQMLHLGQATREKNLLNVE
jgi:hypothetical protein